jgi:uncharacterized membrane protein YtjA (UPF0391 family)
MVARQARGMQASLGLFNRRSTMLSWAILFFILALVAAVFGFGGFAGTFAGIAKVLLALFVIAFIVSLVMGRRSGPPM